MKKVFVFTVMLFFLSSSLALAVDKKALRTARSECVKAAKQEKVPKKQLKAYLKQCLADKGFARKK